MLQSRHIPPPHSSVAALRSTLLTMGTVTVSSPRFVNISTLGFGCMRLPEYQLEEGSWQVDQEKIQYAASKGLGVVVMGPVGGRRLAAPTNLGEKLVGEGLNTYELALRFVLGNPGVCCALSGMQTYEMVDKNAAVASLETPMTEKE